MPYHRAGFRHQLTTFCSQVYIVGSFFVYTVLLVSLIDCVPAPTVAQFVPWALSIPIELVILGNTVALYTSPHHEPVVGNPYGGPLRTTISSWEIGSIVTASTRLLALLSIVLLYSLNTTWPALGQLHSSCRSPSEFTPLLHANGNGNDTRAQNGTFERQEQQDRKPVDGWVRPNKLPSTSWWEYLSGYSLFFPYLWPSKSWRLQLVVVVCFILVMIQRVVNVLVPYQVGVIITILSRQDHFYLPWEHICLYVFYRWLQGNQGLVGSIRSFLWIPVSQYSYSELSTAAFEHVHSLSLDFHLGKKTGEVLSALSKGSSINTFLENVTFQVIPMLIDLCVAIVYFVFVFDVYYALVVTVITFVYLYITVRMAQWRADIRRQMVNASRQEDAVK